MSKQIYILLVLTILTSCVVESKNFEVQSNSSQLKSNSSPSCEKICDAKNHLELKSNQNSGYSYLAFPNFGFRGIGRCRGHALLTQKMNFLASFKKGKKCNVKETECMEKIKVGINKILKFKTHIFTGYRNLKEFSDVPQIQSYLRAIIAGTSHRFRSKTAQISMNVYSSVNENTFYEVVKRVESGHLPYLSLKGFYTGAHAVLVYSASMIGSKDVLCARDPNFESESAENCENFFYLNENKEIIFQRGENSPDVMETFLLTGDEELRVEKYKKALGKQCINNLRTSKKCL